MRTYFLIAALFLSQKIFLSSCTAAYEKFIDADGNVTAPIISCLKLTGIHIKDESIYASHDQPEPVLTICSRKLEEVVNTVQGKINPNISWMMKGKRWEMYNPLLTPITAKKILEI